MTWNVGEQVLIYLVRVDLDDSTVMHARGVVLLVLISIVGVDGVGHIRADEHTLVHRLLKRGG